MGVSGQVCRVSRDAADFVCLTALLAQVWPQGGAELVSVHSVNGRLAWVELRTAVGAFRLYVNEIAYAAGEIPLD